MAGVEEGRAQARRQFDLLAIGDDASETVEHLHARRAGDKQRLDRLIPRAAPLVRACTKPRFLLLQMRGVEQHQPRQFARRRRGDDLAAKAALA